MFMRKITNKFLVGMMAASLAVTSGNIVSFAQLRNYKNNVLNEENASDIQITAYYNETTSWAIAFKSDQLSADCKNNKVFFSEDNGNTWFEGVVSRHRTGECFFANLDVNGDEELKPATVYQMYVVDEKGNKSNTLTATTGFNFEGFFDENDQEINMLEVVKVTSKSCTLTWAKVEGATGYVVTLGDGSPVYKVVKDNTVTVNADECEGGVSVHPYYQYDGYCIGLKGGCHASGSCCWDIGQINTIYFEATKPKIDYFWSTLNKSIYFDIYSNYNDDGAPVNYQAQCYDVKTGKKLSSKRTKGQTISNVSTDTIYKLRVRHKYKYNDEDQEKYTKWSNYTYLIPKPNQDASKDKNAINVTWNKAYKASGYDIYLGTSEGKLKKVASVGKGKTSYKIKSFKGKKISQTKNYYYCVVTKVKVDGKTYKSKISGNDVY